MLFWRVLTVDVQILFLSHIKMSSPNLNNIIIAGCVIAYVPVVLFGLGSRYVHTTAIPYICAVRIFL